VNGDRLALLDVNVPMYAAGQAHPYREACVWVMTEITEGRLAAAIDTEIIQEILYRYGALQQWSVAVAMATSLLDVVPTVFPVQPTDARLAIAQPTDARLAIALFERYAVHGIRARDLLHAAVMRNNDVTAVISTDAHFDRIEGIMRLDPHDLFEQAHT
jgi:predicted nucleic acid-binding protein